MASVYQKKGSACKYCMQGVKPGIKLSYRVSVSADENSRSDTFEPFPEISLHALQQWKERRESAHVFVGSNDRQC